MNFSVIKNLNCILKYSFNWNEAIKTTLAKVKANAFQLPPWFHQTRWELFVFCSELAMPLAPFPSCGIRPRMWSERQGQELVVSSPCSWRRTSFGTFVSFHSDGFNQFAAWKSPSESKSWPFTEFWLMQVRPSHASALCFMETKSKVSSCGWCRLINDFEVNQEG